MGFFEVEVKPMAFEEARNTDLRGAVGAAREERQSGVVDVDGSLRPEVH